MSLSTPNTLVRYLKPQEVFHNNFNNGQKQMPVDCQTLLTLLRIEYYGNRTFPDKITAIAAVESGTVDCTYCQVIRLFK